MELLKDILFHDQLIEILEKIIDKKKIPILFNYRVGIFSYSIIQSSIMSRFCSFNSSNLELTSDNLSRRSCAFSGLGSHILSNALVQ